ncbi:lysine N(6)-hydroxylase/L-ornithine N(5)-oxygenase family protein [Pseudomonas coleopterorum]|uniref:Lysine N(6)-hydroxylase/L-ornithine N(5)-oxygenase family protein n=1 Tax=Pseudomonas coleopterorum TaxID=1605838 RepID=A0ABR9BXT2_9PSED|nr:SidA/IucD/PvdA family monooxygenase [Pseudomonas coleopterorum]MBD8754209.1 lysine N(6)-hydroxylase/L-ornithine N(5)-oxygenase family protein [Pseudomonas coleopterorum]MBD8769697.1 lysine N(6)-hydroxylase/L-ornithine N(5)-oxygenase family protein [Pseudomonas coleopterorum]
MTQHLTPTAPHDLIGIGFGPSNLALAIALQERAEQGGRPFDALFLERQPDYSWHGNTLVAQSELQISFLKDLVTLRNPSSRFSFVNYLKAHGRLVDFINLGTFYPCRMEYNDYLRWVAQQFAEQSRYGEQVLRVEPIVDGDGRVQRLNVVSQHQGREVQRQTRSVIVSTGGTPKIPQAFASFKDDPRVFHHARYLSAMATQPCSRGEPMRIAVVGAGQSAAEAFIDLNDSYPNVQVDMILRAAVLKPADDSPFVNEIFGPDYTDLVFNQPETERERLIREYHNTNYSVVDLDLIERIYAMLYRQKVSGVERHGFLCRRMIESATDVDGRVQLQLRDLATGSTEARRYDAVILATGYERRSHRELLAPLKDYLDDFRVDRDYQLIARPELEAPVFIQGFSQHSHGLSDTLLSVLPARSGEIAAALEQRLEGVDQARPSVARRAVGRSLSA